MTPGDSTLLNELMMKGLLGLLNGNEIKHGFEHGTFPGRTRSIDPPSFQLRNPDDLVNEKRGDWSMVLRWLIDGWHWFLNDDIRVVAWWAYSSCCRPLLTKGVSDENVL